MICAQSLRTGGVKPVGNSPLRSIVAVAGMLLAITAASWAQTRRHQAVYYEPTVKQIIRQDCGRCHSGPTRYLMDYDSLKSYADSGLLATMIQGPMNRFAGNDARTLLNWIDAGAPEKPAGGQPAAFVSPACPNPAVHGTGRGAGAGMETVTYRDTIARILKRDCLRCHSGRFRNLTTYNEVKRYADNGLLKTLVQRGGPMHRFAGPDSRVIIAWIDAGAPQ